MGTIIKALMTATLPERADAKFRIKDSRERRGSLSESFDAMVHSLRLYLANRAQLIPCFIRSPTGEDQAE